VAWKAAVRPRRPGAPGSRGCGLDDGSVMRLTVLVENRAQEIISDG
jgi:hypothetical protein